MRTAIIIPAKLHSRRLPEKNIKLLHGKSLLERAVEVARKVSADVYVSTPDDRIAEKARELGAEVIMRPPALAADDVELVPEVVRHAINVIPDYDNYCLLQVTNPFVTEKMLKAALTVEFADAVKPCGAFYQRPKRIWESDRHDCRRHMGEAIDMTYSVDIDTLEDWLMAEQFIQLLAETDG